MTLINLKIYFSTGEEKKILVKIFDKSELPYIEDNGKIWVNNKLR